jgi:phosphoglycolate phosphatase-like HAD superfamily hydrolase
MKRIIVDIDNTLWDFASVFRERIKEIVPTIPPINEWKWDFYMEYISIEELYSICNDIHKEQDLFEPFSSAKWFLESLINEGCEIIIASHRDENSREATEKFLQKHNLSYNELHLSNNKTILFDSSMAIVDDAPHLLDEAKQKGLICTGLRWPWNKNTEHSLFDSLEEVLKFLLEELSGQNRIVCVNF